MKQLSTKLLIILAFFFAFCYGASASSYPARLGAKLGNGIANAATGIVEIPKTIMVANREHGPAYAATAGFVTGLVHMTGRTLSGAYDLVTFIVPTKPIVTPDYVWEDFDKETSYRSTWQLR
ncbi:MAG: exosortase system-associated protein, TIGR04073 family [Methylovulum sp.]|jgi:putative exosortase-associated protein (TIGR04073 family)|nr:exosortase system-associated protein, TIGR04073 family [Methylovulum sp.]MCF7998813.1 exosortase system-associated protein, TIGR04073 family [Methylovulum sp.]